jgi:hypothetical protein
MNVEQITPKMLDAAIRWQTMAEQGDRGKFAEQAFASREFREYIADLLATAKERGNMPGILLTALTIGIEIGMALEEMQRRPQA